MSETHRFPIPIPGPDDVLQALRILEFEGEHESTVLKEPPGDPDVSGRSGFSGGPVFPSSIHGLGLMLDESLIDDLMLADGPEVQVPVNARRSTSARRPIAPRSQELDLPAFLSELPLVRRRVSAAAGAPGFGGSPLRKSPPHGLVGTAPVIQPCASLLFEETVAVAGAQPGPAAQAAAAQASAAQASAARRPVSTTIPFPFSTALAGGGAEPAGTLAPAARGAFAPQSQSPAALHPSGTACGELPRATPAPRATPPATAAPHVTAAWHATLESRPSSPRPFPPVLLGLASLVLPGWGQSLNEENRKAMAFRIAALLTLGVADLVIFHQRFEALLGALVPLDAVRASGWLPATLLVGSFMWALSAYDALIVGSHRRLTA